MTVALPAPIVIDADGQLVPTSVQQDLDALSWLFPLGPGAEMFSVVPQVRVYRSVDQSIPNNTETVIAWDAELFETGAPIGSELHTLGAPASKLIGVIPGLYAVHVNVAFDANAAGRRMVRIRYNGGAPFLAQAELPPCPGATYTQICVSGLVRLALNDYVDCTVAQDSGGALAVKATSVVSVTEFGMYWISP